MAFISSAKNSSGNEEVNTASIPTASTYVSPASANIGAARWDWSFMANEEENHAWVADEEAPTEFALIAKTSAERLLEFADDTVTDYSRPSPAIKSTSDDLQNRNSSVTETGTSPSNIISKTFIKFVKATDSPTKNITDKVETVKKPAVKYAELYRKPLKKSNVRRNQRNWNNLKSQQLENFPLVTQKFPLLIWERMETLLRPQRVGFGNQNRILLLKGNSQNHIDDKGYWDSGCSRHMTGNISYLSDYEPFDGGYVSFGQGGCKITGKGTIKTDKLEFENMYFVKDLKYNMSSVSQICDNKNSVLFTDSECIVLGRDFKLIDDTNVLLRTP
nr:ribonuclease H-like domain-containing protein [Tanacetum cinerariifolium]